MNSSGILVERKLGRFQEIKLLLKDLSSGNRGKFPMGRSPVLIFFEIDHHDLHHHDAAKNLKDRSILGKYPTISDEGPRRACSVGCPLAHILLELGGVLFKRAIAFAHLLQSPFCLVAP